MGKFRRLRLSSGGVDDAAKKKELTASSANDSSSALAVVGKFRAGADTALASRKSDVLAKFKSSGDAEKERLEEEERQRKAAEKQAEFERRVQDRIETLRSVVSSRLKLATVLDYTNSTMHDVAGFVREIDRLMQMLQEEFLNVDYLPVASKGTGGGGHAHSNVGRVGDKKFYNREHNSVYWHNDGATPVGHGMSAVLSQNFYASNVDSRELNALVVISDVHFDRFSDHERMIDGLNARDVAVASLNSDKPRNHYQHLKGLGENLAVVDRRNPEMDPVRLIFEFIMSKRDEILRPQAEAEVREEMAKEDRETAARLKISAPRSFADHLRLKGFGREAGNVLEAPKRKLLE